MRPFAPADLEAVRDVCFETGLMGDPIAAQFSDRDTFAHVFCDWYVLYRAATCWVVDDGSGRAVGYLIGSPDAPDESDHQRRVLRTHLLGRRVLLQRDTVRFLGRAIVDLARDRRALHDGFDLLRYPAELHIDLLPEARGRGLGSTLMRCWLDRLAELGVPGVHLSTFAENTGAVGFFESQGFEAVGDDVPAPGFRQHDGSRVSVRRFCREVA